MKEYELVDCEECLGSGLDDSNDLVTEACFECGGRGNYKKVINIGGAMDYDAVIKVEWATTFEADSKIDFIRKCKEQWKQDYNIDLTDDEIQIMEDK